MAETLRSSGFIDEPLSASGEGNSVDEEAMLIEEGSLIGMIGITIRQTLQIVIPLLITLRVLKSTRRQRRRRQVAVT